MVAELPPLRLRLRPAAEPPAITLPALHENQNDLTLLVSTHPRARNLAIRLDTKAGHFILTKPPRTPLAEAQQFARKHQQWLHSQLAQLAPRIEFKHGNTIPLYGEATQIRLDPAVSKPRVHDAQLLVAAARKYPPDPPPEIPARRSRKIYPRPDSANHPRHRRRRARPLAAPAARNDRRPPHRPRHALGQLQPQRQTRLLMETRLRAALGVALCDCPRGRAPLPLQPLAQILEPRRRPRAAPPGRPTLASEKRRPAPALRSAARRSRKLNPPPPTY